MMEFMIRAGRFGQVKNNRVDESPELPENYGVVKIPILN